MRTSGFTLLAALCVAVLVSCVSRSDELDLSRNFSLDVRLAEEPVNLPLGEFGKFYLDSLLKIDKDDPDATILVLPDGVYGLKKSGSIKPVSVTLQQMSVKLDSIKLKNIDLDFTSLPAIPEIAGIDIPLPLTFSTEIADTGKVSINEKIDDAVLALGSLIFAEGPTASVDFLFSEIPSCIDSVNFNGFRFTFPDFFEVGYKGSDSKVSVSGNVLSLNGTVSAAELRGNNNILSIGGLCLKRFHFEPALATTSDSDGRRLILDGRIICKGRITAYVGSLTVGNLGHLYMRPVLNLGNFGVRSFSGKAFRKFDRVSERIAVSLGKDLDFLKSADNSFSFSDITVSADLISDIAIPLNVETSFSSSTADGQTVCDGIGCGFRLPAASASGEKRTSHVVFSNSPKSDGPDDIPVFVSNLGDLVRQIPDNISIDLCAETDTAESKHYIEFGHGYEISGSYDVLVPFKFDALKLGYSKLIDVEVGDDSFIDVKEGASAKLSLKAVIVNTIPLNLQIGVTATGNDGKSLSDKVRFSSVTVEAGSLEKPTETPMELSAEISGVCLSDLKGLDLKVKAFDNGHDGVVLNKNEYFEFRNAVLSLEDVDVVIK